MSLIDEISLARDAVTRLEAETSDAGHKLRLSKEKLRKSRQELDALLVELVSGESRYPLFPAETAGNGQASAPPAAAEPPLGETVTRSRRSKKGASAP